MLLDPVVERALIDGSVTRPNGLRAGLDFLEARAATYVACYALFYGAALLVGWVFAFHTGYDDYKDYLALTSGDSANVPEPFASRVFAPFMAARLADWTGMGARDALAVVSFAATALCALPAAGLLRLARIPLPWALVIATAPYPALAVGYYLVPDGMAALFVLTCFYGIAAKTPWLSGAGAALAMLTRNTSLLAIGLWSAFSASVRATRWAAIAALVGVAIGMVLLKTLFPPQASNVHEMSGALYFLLKPAVNAVKNLLGVELYLNTVDWCAPPVAVFDISFIPGLGNITEIGYCRINAMRPLYSVLSYLMIFGIAPLLIARAMMRTLRDSEKLTLLGNAASLAAFAPFTILFLLSPTFGITIKRLFVESYPLLFPIAALFIPTCTSQDRLKPLWWIGYNIVGFILLANIHP